VEVVIAVTLGTSVVVTATAGYTFVSKSWLFEGQRLQTQQNLRLALDVLSREVRLAGACLPDAGPAAIKPLAGTDAGTTDTITVRANVRCAIATTVEVVPVGTTTIRVDTVANFVAGMQAYILHADTTMGEYVTIASVSVTPPRLTLAAGTTQTYPAGSSVYGAESQTYAIDASGAAPVLTVASAGGAARPVVAGVERLNVQYVLNRNCVPGPCDVVDLPADAAEWALVRAVRVDVGVRSLRRVPAAEADGFYRLGQAIEVKPRNLLF
jgi:Tfp pilus assembly protein PilW